jgi:hypothetical protein
MPCRDKNATPKPAKLPPAIAETQQIFDFRSGTRVVNGQGVGRRDRPKRPREFEQERKEQNFMKTVLGLMMAIVMAAGTTVFAAEGPTRRTTRQDQTTQQNNMASTKKMKKARKHVAKKKTKKRKSKGASTGTTTKKTS